MRGLGRSNGRGLELEQEMAGGVKIQGRVSNISVSEARTHWPLALLLRAETFLFTDDFNSHWTPAYDFNSHWTPALAWQCSEEKNDILYCYLKTLKSFSLTGDVLCFKLSSSSVWSSTFTFSKGIYCVWHLSKVSVRTRFQSILHEIYFYKIWSNSPLEWCSWWIY